MGRTVPSAPQSTTPNARHRERAAVLLLVLAGPVLYGAGLWAASIADGRPLGEVACFDPAAVDQLSPFRTAATAVMAVGAALLLFAAPWLLGTLALQGIQSKRATAGAWSLAANSAALILVCLILRNTVGMGRVGFLAAWLAWTGALCFPAACRAVSRPGEIGSLWRRWAVGMSIGAAAVAVGIVLFHREHFIQCFNGDGTEFSELARSLRHHFLPYWEIETAGRFGTFIANPSVINSYWTLGLQLLLGEGELAARMSCWVWWLGIFAVSLRMVQGKTARGAWRPAIPLALAMLLTSVWYTFYVGYYPYMADLANPAVPDALFTLLLLLALDCLRRGDCAGWVVSMILASLVFYAGGVMFLLMGGAAWVWQPVRRRQIVRAAAIGILLLAGIACGYLVVGWQEGSLPGWWNTLDREWFRKYSTLGPQGNLYLLFVAYLLLGCGAVPVIGLFRTFGRHTARRDVAWDRTAATVTLAYLLIIMGSGHKNLHYLGPLLPIPLILWLKCPRDETQLARTRWAAPLAATLGLALCIALCWPVSRPTFTLNRQLGAVTTFVAGSREDAWRWGRIARELYEQGKFGWYVGEHTWVHYSQLAKDPAAPRPLLVTDGLPSAAEYGLVFESAEGVKLYCRDPHQIPWLARQRPSAGPDRFPWVFQPIATRTRPRGTGQPETANGERGN